MSTYSGGVCDYTWLADAAINNYANAVGSMEIADANWTVVGCTNPLEAVMNAQQVDTSAIASNIKNANSNFPGWSSHYAQTQESLLTQREQYWQNMATPDQAQQTASNNLVQSDQSNITNLVQVFGYMNSTLSTVTQILQGSL